VDEKTSGDRDSDKVVGRSPNEVLDHFSVRSAGTVPAITVALRYCFGLASDHGLVNIGSALDDGTICGNTGSGPDKNREFYGDLLSNSRTAPVGIPLLHFDDRTDEFCARPFRAGLPTAILGEQQAVLSLAQGSVKAKQCRRLHYNCGTEQTGWKHQEPQQSGKNAVPGG